MIIECPNHSGSFDCSPFCELCEGCQEYEQPDSELERIEQIAQRYLKLLKQGNYAAAKTEANTLVYATYTLDPVWLKADKRNRGIK